MIGAIIGGIGSFFGSLFGFKKKQAETVQTAFKVLNNAESTEAARTTAAAKIISSEAQAGGLAAQWRPILMIVFAVMVVSFFFGYTPPHLEKPMSPMMAELFGLLKLGIGGYIGGRSLEKIASSFQLGKVLTKLIEKKLL